MEWRAALRADLARHTRRDYLSIATLTLVRLSQGVDEPGFGWSRHVIAPLVKVAKFVWIELFMSAQIPRATVIGPGLRLPHGGRGVMIHPETTIGSNCTIFEWVGIGAIEVLDDENREQYAASGVPSIGDNVYIGCGALIFGDIHVGDRSRVGVGAVVIRDVPPDSTVLPVPGKILRRNGRADDDVQT